MRENNVHRSDDARVMFEIVLYASFDRKSIANTRNGIEIADFEGRTSD